MNQAIRRFDCADPEQRAAGIEEAAAAAARGELVVLPTDTVYGIGADAFMPTAVLAMLTAKGRGRHMPSPVLVGSVRAAAALIDDLGMHGQDLIDEFWPGALTIVCHASRTLSWDLGETKGTVAVRMPLHPVALELLKRTGPMAVSSANKSGQAPARTIAEAAAQLGDSVAVYLDGGPAAGGVPSSIVDLTGTVPRLLRAGAISPERLRTVAPIVESTEIPERSESAGAAEAGAFAASRDDATPGGDPPAPDGDGPVSSGSAPALGGDGPVSGGESAAEAGGFVASRGDATSGGDNPTPGDTPAPDDPTAAPGGSAPAPGRDTAAPAGGGPVPGGSDPAAPGGVSSHT